MGVRESMKVLPSFLQPFLTWMTGKALPGQKPLIPSNTAWQAGTALACLLGGGVAISLRWAPMGLLLPIAWVFMAGAARKIQVTLIHQCVHWNFTGNRKFDRLAGDAMGLLVLVDHFDSYYHEHVLVHHTKHLGSEEDPDCRFLLQLGFKPGMSVAQLRRKLIATIFSPSFHWNFLRARLVANLLRASLPRRVLAWTVYPAALGALAMQFGWSALVLGWFIPLFPVYHVAALLNFSSLHFWLRPAPESPLSAKETLARFTAGRFVGEAVPSPGLGGWSKAGAWVGWSFRMLFIHLPSRIMVLSGDLPVHDFHHRHPRKSDWSQYLYHRQWDIDAGMPGWNIPYEENWGLWPALNAVFAELSRATPREEEAMGLTDGEVLQFMVQM